MTDCDRHYDPANGRSIDEAERVRGEVDENLSQLCEVRVIRGVTVRVLAISAHSNGVDVDVCDAQAFE